MEQKVIQVCNNFVEMKFNGIPYKKLNETTFKPRHHRL